MDEWEKVDGYSNNDEYYDEVTCQIDTATKTISILKEQTLIAGEANSQYVSFQIPRFYDGIDLSTKKIGIIYCTELGNFDIESPINVKRNAEYLTFGWLVSGQASAEPGTLSFSVDFTGDQYSLKTLPKEMSVLDSMQGDAAVQEPFEQTWYTEIQSRCEKALSKAEEILNEYDELETMIDESEVLEGGWT